MSARDSALNIAAPWLDELAAHLPALLGEPGPFQFEVLPSPTQPAAGALGLQSESGQQWVAKWDDALRSSERHQRILQSLAATAVPAPAPVGIIELADGGSVLVMERLPGATWYAQAGDPDLDRQRVDGAVEILLTLRSLDHLPWPRRDFGAVVQQLQDDVEEYQPFLQQGAFGAVAEQALDLLAATAAIEPWETVADHGDFGPHNLLCQEGAITGLVDWGGAWRRDASQALGIALAETLGLTIALSGRVDLAKRLLRGYAAGCGMALSEVLMRALPRALSCTLDWLIYGKNAPAPVQRESLGQLVAWGRAL